MFSLNIYTYVIKGTFEKLCAFLQLPFLRIFSTTIAPLDSFVYLYEHFLLEYFFYFNYTVYIIILTIRWSQNFDLILVFNATFSYIMVISLSGGRSRREPPTMGTEFWQGLSGSMS
jgi:hypothetical protein